MKSGPVITKDDPGGYLYIASNPANNLTKIGITSNAKRRLVSLQSTFGKSILLNGVWWDDDAYNTEKELHWIFAAFKVAEPSGRRYLNKCREWFNLSLVNKEGLISMLSNTLETVDVSIEF